MARTGGRSVRRAVVEDIHRSHRLFSILACPTSAPNGEAQAVGSRSVGPETDKATDFRLPAVAISSPPPRRRRATRLRRRPHGQPLRPSERQGPRRRGVEPSRGSGWATISAIPSRSPARRPTSLTGKHGSVNTTACRIPSTLHSATTRGRLGPGGRLMPTWAKPPRAKQSRQSGHNIMDTG